MLSLIISICYLSGIRGLSTKSWERGEATAMVLENGFHETLGFVATIVVFKFLKVPSDADAVVPWTTL